MIIEDKEKCPNCDGTYGGYVSEKKGKKYCSGCKFVFNPNKYEKNKKQLTLVAVFGPESGNYNEEFLMRLGCSLIDLKKNN